MGGLADNRIAGAAWVYTRSKAAWTQQRRSWSAPSREAPPEGFSVALSDDGNTAIVGRPFDNFNMGRVGLHP